MTPGDLDGLGYRGATVVVTGGASGMGEAATRILTDLGAQVHVADIREPKVPCASYTPIDLADAASVIAAAGRLREVGPIDFLFPIAGIPPHTLGPLTCMLVNYAGTRQFTESLLPAMRDGGTIGLIASVAARFWREHLDENLRLLELVVPDELRAFYEANPAALRDGYSPSKELLAIWIQQVAPRLARERRIRINCIAPAASATPFMDVTYDHVGRDYFADYPCPLLGRMADADDQAWSLLLLSSPLNTSVTGTMLYTDQGYVGGLTTGSLKPPGGGRLQPSVPQKAPA